MILKCQEIQYIFLHINNKDNMFRKIRPFWKGVITTLIIMILVVGPIIPIALTSNEAYMLLYFITIPILFGIIYEII